jgi:AAA domain/Nuclease-related domain
VVSEGSARREALLSARMREAHLAAAEVCRRREINFTLADRSERRVAAAFADLTSLGWRSLPDRRWPRTRAANIDLVAVGPGGVLVVDVKAWAEPRIEDGRLYRGQAPADDEVAKLRRITECVEGVAARCGLVPQRVLPVLVLAGRTVPATPLGRVVVLGEQNLPLWVASRPHGLPAALIEDLFAALAEALPAHDEPAPAVVRAVVPRPVLPRELPPVEQLSLVDTDELTAALVAGAAAEPIEPWMTFLHPALADLVRRPCSGPARIRGPAGTGKTVVALHRAAYLAATRPGRILVTGYVRTLPALLGSLYRSLSPDTADRVEFIGIDSWARRFLDSRGVRCNIDKRGVDSSWTLAWLRVGADSRLPNLVSDPHYWRAEIDHVIKARGLRDYADYLDADRPGRRVPLQTEHKAVVWDLYEHYQRLLADRALMDFSDVRQLAIDELTARPPDPRYAAVIVDEVTDLDLLGLRLVRQLAGDGPDRLLLIGDGRQAVYPGGARLADAGIDVTGRATVLRANYRNTGAVLAAATRLVPTVRSAEQEDSDESPLSVERPRGRPARWMVTRNGDVHDEALIADLRSAAGRYGYAGLAVLCQRNADVETYRGLLARHQIPTINLLDYTGTPVDKVKIGTYKRAKGIDFAAVFLPRIPAPIDTAVYADPASRERSELQDREVHVAATRARDELWLGCLGWTPTGPPETPAAPAGAG